MPSVQTLNDITHLERSRFGRPPPRHGLKLLYWFATECVTFDKDNNMVSQCEPDNGDYGFHPFQNRYDRSGKKLLPEVNFPYYVLGNLNSEGAQDLPFYIFQEYTGQYGSNKDRIIVSLDNDLFSEVYVAEHSNQSSYSPLGTYRISKGLLMSIRRLTLEDFLRQTGYWHYQVRMAQSPVVDFALIQRPQIYHHQSTRDRIATWTGSHLLSQDSCEASETELLESSRSRCCKCTIL